MRIIKKATMIEFDFDEICEILVNYVREHNDPFDSMNGLPEDFQIDDIQADAGNFTIYILD